MSDIYSQQQENLSHLYLLVQQDQERKYLMQFKI